MRQWRERAIVLTHIPGQQLPFDVMVNLSKASLHLDYIHVLWSYGASGAFRPRPSLLTWHITQRFNEQTVPFDSSKNNYYLTITNTNAAASNRS